MSDKDTGGPAFPRTVQQWNSHLESFDGMTLRDWFAGQALPQAYSGCIGSSPDEGDRWVDMVAREAYDMADAMIEARK